MGQAQSDSYDCEPDDNDSKSQPNLAPPSSNNNSNTSNNNNNNKTLAGPKNAPSNKQTAREKVGGNQARQRPARYLARGDNNQATTRLKKEPTPSDRMTLDQQQRHVRKLSNVSNRNIQLLSIKPRSEKDTYAEGLRSRRRSSLINLILGAPSRGPRFSEDLCSLSSHMSELCNFGIDYFPDTHIHQPAAPSIGGGPPSSPSIGSSLCRLEDGFVSLRPAVDARPPLAKEFAPSLGRRRSSLGSLTSFEATPSHQSRAETKNSFAALDNLIRQQTSDARGPPKESDVHSASGVAASHRQRQLDRPDERPATADRAACLTPLASVDLTSSLDDHQHTYENGDPPFPAADNQSGNVAGQKKGQYYLSCLVGRKRAGALMESARDDSGCSQDTASLSSTPSLLLSSSANLSGLAAAAAAAAAPAANDAAALSAGGSAATAAAAAAAAIGDKGAATGRAAFASGGRINHGARRMIHRSGSELSLYSGTSGSLSHKQPHERHAGPRRISRGSIGAVMLEVGAGGRQADLFNGPVPGDASRHSLHQSVNDRTRAPTATQPPPTTASSHLRETKLIIMLQVCLPFILAGFGNMGAGLVLNQIARWEAFQKVPIFFVLLPSFVGLKGNIEMTLASRLSTLSNLNLLDTSYQRRHAFLTNLILILSQAIGLSIYAAVVSVACEFALGKLDNQNVFNILNISLLIVLPAALATSITLVIISSLVMWFAIWLAKQLQVNPDNLSTLMAALYGDVSCVLTYGLFAQSMYSLNQQEAAAWPVGILTLALTSWPLLWYVAYQARETHELALSSMPPMLAAIMVSLGSGAVLSLVVDKFGRVALYQPVVNGFGANLIAVQASRVSTWLWCTALRRLSAAPPPPPPRPLPPTEGVKTGLGFEFEPNNKMPYGSLASFVELPGARIASVMGKQAARNKHREEDGPPSWVSKLEHLPRTLVKIARLLLWSFCNSSPNSTAARLLLVMLVPAHSLYFVVIWLAAPAHYIVLTWPFYIIYVSLCVVQVFVLLCICQPLMTFLMHKHLDPDIFGISLLMALADLIGTLCLTGAFYLLNSIGDPNAL